MGVNKGVTFWVYIRFCRENWGGCRRVVAQGVDSCNVGGGKLILMRTGRVVKEISFWTKAKRKMGAGWKLSAPRNYPFQVI